MYGFGEGHLWPGVAKLNEEAGEVIQEIGKLMMIGGEVNHWSGNLRKRLFDEMADLMASLYFVRNHNMSQAEKLAYTSRIVAKLARFEQWHKEGMEHENKRPPLENKQ